MKKPYELFFHEPVKVMEPDLKDRYKLCTYPLAFSQEIFYYEMVGTSLVSQRYNQKPFYFDLIEINSSSEVFSYGFEVKERQLFLFFLLEGTIIFTSENGFEITRTKSNHFLMAYFDKGRYLVGLKYGRSIGFVITISPLWAVEVGEDFEHIGKLLCEFENNFTSYYAYHQGRIDKRVSRLLYKLLMFGKSPKCIMDGHIRKYIAFILQHYNQMIDNKYHGLTYRIARYLDEHYAHEELSNHFLTEQFAITEKTMISLFREGFNVTPYQYYTRLRMKKAEKLISEGLRIENVYSLVGYKNGKAFRIAYKKYHNNENK